jgi:PhnB protein
MVQAIPKGYHSITPYLSVHGATRVVEFLQAAFDAEIIERMDTPDGAVMHAEARIGDSIAMIGEAREPHPPMPSTLYFYVPDVDAVYRRAIEAGATSISEPADQFYGDRHGGVVDPAGNRWYIATHVEDVSPDEMARRAEAHAKKLKEAQ